MPRARCVTPRLPVSLRGACVGGHQLSSECIWLDSLTHIARLHPAEYATSCAQGSVQAQHSVAGNLRTHATYQRRLLVRAQVLYHIAQLCPALSDEQRQQLAADVEATVGSWSLDDLQTYRSAPSLAQGVSILGLGVSPTCVAELYSVMQRTPHELLLQISARVLAQGLLHSLQLGCPVSLEDARRWRVGGHAVDRVVVRGRPDTPRQRQAGRVRGAALRTGPGAGVRALGATRGVAGPGGGASRRRHAGPRARPALPAGRGAARHGLAGGPGPAGCATAPAAGRRRQRPAWGAGGQGQRQA